MIFSIKNEDFFVSVTVTHTNKTAHVTTAIIYTSIRANHTITTAIHVIATSKEVINVTTAAYSTTTTTIVTITTTPPPPPIVYSH